MKKAYFKGAMYAKLSLNCFDKEVIQMIVIKKDNDEIIEFDLDTLESKIIKK